MNTDRFRLADADGRQPRLAACICGLFSRLLAAGFLLAAFLVRADAAEWPVKPVRWVIGAAPDVLPRMVGQKLADAWGQQIVVDQRPGAAGITRAT